VVVEEQAADDTAHDVAQPSEVHVEGPGLDIQSAWRAYLDRPHRGHEGPGEPALPRLLEAPDRRVAHAPSIRVVAGLVVHCEDEPEVLVVLRRGLVAPAAAGHGDELRARLLEQATRWDVVGGLRLRAAVDTPPAIGPGSRHRRGGAWNQERTTCAAYAHRRSQASGGLVMRDTAMRLVTALRILS
jgi:hypothetical protein